MGHTPHGRQTIAKRVFFAAFRAILFRLSTIFNLCA